MTNKTFKNLSTLSAQLFLGTALVAGSAHGTTFTVNNAGNGLTQVHTNAQIANANLEADGTSHTLYFTHGGANMTAAADLTPFSKTQTISFTADTAMDFITTGFAGIAGPINLKTDGANVITLTTATANRHSYTGTTTVAGSGGLTLNGANILPLTNGTLGTDVTIQDTATLEMTSNSQTVNSVVMNGSSSTAALKASTGLLTVTTDFTLTKGKVTISGAAGGVTVTKTINTAASQEIALNNATATLTAANGTVAGTITGSASTEGKLVKSYNTSTDNTLTLSGTNTFGATIVHEGGTLVSSNALGLGAAASVAAIDFSTVASAGYEKTLKTTIAQTESTRPITMDASTDKVIFDIEGDAKYTGVFTNTAGVAGTSSFIKKGTKKLSIGNATAVNNTYVGTAKVQKGILEINAGGIAGMAVNIEEDATLAGSSTAGTATTGAVISAGKIKPGLDTVGTGILTLTVPSLETTSTLSSVEILASSTTAYNKFVVTDAVTETAKGTLDFVLSSGAVADATTGLVLADVVTVGSITGVSLTTDAEANAYLATRRTRVLNPHHLLSNVELKAGTEANQVTATIKDISNDLGSRFDDKELADTFLKDYLVAGLQSDTNVTEYDSNVSVITSNTGTGYTSNDKPSERLTLAVADLMLASKTIGKAASGKYLSQLSGSSNRSAMESTASAINAVSGAVSSHVASALGGASPYTAAPVAFNAGFRNTDGALAKVATDSGLSSGCALDESLDNGAWVKAFGGWENLSNDGSSHPGNRTTVAGAAFGFDHYFTRDLLAGIAISYARINTTVNDDLGDSKADSYSATIYGGARFDDLTVDASVMLASNHFDMTRKLSIPAVSGTQSAKASPKSLDVGMHLGAGYLIRTQSVDVTPFASVDYRNASFDAYTETNLTDVHNAFLLHADKARLQIWTPKVGVALSKAMVMAGGNWTPTLSVGWKAFVPMGDNTVDTKIVGFLNSFESKHVVKTRHMGFAGLGVELDMRSGWHVNFGYEGAYNNKLNTHEFMVKVGKRF